MIKAIETGYKGYKFRSRLEARWAVFFDAIGIKWQYEPEGFDLDGIWYLPDFYLPSINSGLTQDGLPPQDGIGLWLEIKPSYEAIEKEIDKLSRFGSAMNHKFYIILGSPYSGDYRIISFARAGILKELKAFPEWVYCEDCKQHGVGWIAGEPYPNVFYCGNCQSFQIIDDPVDFCKRVSATPKFINAWNAARQARFEHGQSG